MKAFPKVCKQARLIFSEHHFSKPELQDHNFDNNQLFILVIYPPEYITVIRGGVYLLAVSSTNSVSICFVLS